MTEQTEIRLFARGVAQVRELTMNDLKLVAGGVITTNNGLDESPGSYECICGVSDDNPCDLDTEYFD